MTSSIDEPPPIIIERSENNLRLYRNDRIEWAAKNVGFQRGSKLEPTTAMEAHSRPSAFPEDFAIFDFTSVAKEALVFGERRLVEVAADALTAWR